MWAQHGEVPLVALLGLVHLGVAGAMLVLGRGGGGDDGGVHQGAALQQKPTAAQQLLDGLEDALGEPMLLQQVTEVQQGRGVGHRLASQIQPQESTKRLAVVDGILQRLVGQPEPLLQKVHAQHPLQPDRRPTAPLSRRGVVVGREHRQQRRPGHHPLHLPEKAVAPRGLALGLVLGLGEGDLLGHEGLHGTGLARPISYHSGPVDMAEFFSVSLEGVDIIKLMWSGV
jgi:hypothetical protein